MCVYAAMQLPVVSSREIRHKKEYSRLAVLDQVPLLVLLRLLRSDDQPVGPGGGHLLRSPEPRRLYHDGRRRPGHVRSRPGEPMTTGIVVFHISFQNNFVRDICMLIVLATVIRLFAFSSLWLKARRKS